MVLYCCAQVWENWSPEDDVVPGQDDDEAEAASSSGAGERMPVTVTEVVSGSEFFMQVCAAAAGRLGLGHCSTCLSTLWSAACMNVCEWWGDA